MRVRLTVDNEGEYRPELWEHEGDPSLVAHPKQQRRGAVQAVNHCPDTPRPVAPDLRGGIGTGSGLRRRHIDRIRP